MQGDGDAATTARMLELAMGSLLGHDHPAQLAERPDDFSASDSR
jgi:hypothetical protein